MRVRSDREEDPVPVLMGSGSTTTIPYQCQCPQWLEGEGGAGRRSGALDGSPTARRHDFVLLYFRKLRPTTTFLLPLRGKRRAGWKTSARGMIDRFDWISSVPVSLKIMFWGSCFCHLNE